MAKIKQGILGGFSGKVANVVGTSWKGRAVMKSQPLSVANPRTDAQTAQRNKFSNVSELASKILTQFIQPVENPISGNISGYNLFCKDNKSAFSALGVLSASNLFAGGGSLEHNQLTAVEFDSSDNSVMANWELSEDPQPLRLEDSAYVVLIKQSGEELSVYFGDDVRENEGATVFQLSGSSAIGVGDTVIGLVAYVSKDGRNVSVKAPAVSLTVTAKA